MPGGIVELTHDPYYNPNLVPRRHDFLELASVPTTLRRELSMTTGLDRSTPTSADVSLLLRDPPRLGDRRRRGRCSPAC